jgi:hypothetical protein
VTGRDRGNGRRRLAEVRPPPVGAHTHRFDQDGFCLTCQEHRAWLERGPASKPLTPGDVLGDPPTRRDGASATDDEWRASGTPGLP